MTKETGGPAYPNSYTLPEYQGMTLRDWLAGMAMQAWIPIWDRDRDFDLHQRSYTTADYMLEVRK